MRGTRNLSSSTAGRAGQHRVARQRRARPRRRRQHVRQRHRVRGRRDVGGGDLADPGDRAEDHVELAGEQVELVVGDGQPGQSGEVGDLVAGDSGSDAIGRRIVGGVGHDRGSLRTHRGGLIASTPCTPRNRRDTPMGHAVRRVLPAADRAARPSGRARRGRDGARRGRRRHPQPRRHRARARAAPPTTSSSSCRRTSSPTRW